MGGGHLNHWAPIFLLCPTEVINDAKQDHGSRNQDRVIHIRESDRLRRRPERKENNDDNITTSEDVVDYSVKTRYISGSPLQFFRVAFINYRPARDYATGAALVEQETRCDEVRGVETGDP